MNILITGGSGQVGFALRHQLCCLGEVLAPSRQELDVTDEQALITWLNHHQPSLIINAAAYTAVDAAEQHPALAQRLNAWLPAYLADFAAHSGATLVHYSSDYVYAGSGNTPWQEVDTPVPVNTYGRTKLAGDNAVLGSTCRHLVLRTSWVYSATGQNFMRTMLRLGSEKTLLQVVNNQHGAPTPATLIALVTHLAIEQHLASGVYHVAPRGETSWHGFAQEIFQRAQALGFPLALTPTKVAGICSADYPTLAQRPLNSRLALGRLEQALGIMLPSWQSQLSLTLETLARTRH